MKNFIDDDFMIHNKTGQHLFNSYAKELPIYDYHCHLPPDEIYEDKRFANLTEVWLNQDHYKWRLMRSYGINEAYITGDADDYEKYAAWAEVVPHLIGNPLYHWTHMELVRYFDINLPLNPKNAKTIWEQASVALDSEKFSARGLIAKSNVKLICTTDDPVDDLLYHKKLKKDASLDVKVLPTFRPEKAVLIEKDFFAPWFEQLQKTRRKSISMFYDFLEALESRMDYFHDNGCRIADCSLAYIPYVQTDFLKAKAAFEKALEGEPLTAREIDEYKTFMLLFFGKNYAKRGWVMQLHIGVIRNNNTRMYQKKGPDMGFDTLTDEPIAQRLAHFLDHLDREEALPKTILYTLNNKDNYVIATMAGNFHDEGVASKIQFGAGWWYNDQKDGMELQMKTLANVSLLPTFVGMLTDSRSFLSYTRHEYFRRILCNMIGEWVEKGEYPNDETMLSKIIRDICYDNARKYFEISMNTK